MEIVGAIVVVVVIVVVGAIVVVVVVTVVVVVIGDAIVVVVAIVLVVGEGVVLDATGVDGDGEGGMEPMLALGTPIALENGVKTSTNGFIGRAEIGPFDSS